MTEDESLVERDSFFGPAFIDRIYINRFRIYILPTLLFSLFTVLQLVEKKGDKVANFDLRARFFAESRKRKHRCWLMLDYKLIHSEHPINLLVIKKWSDGPSVVFNSINAELEELESSIRNHEINRKSRQRFRVQTGNCSTW